MEQNEQENRRRAQTFAEQAAKIDRENKELAMEIAQQVEVRVSAMEALAGNHTEVLHGHEGRIVLLEEDSSRTHFILGDVDRRLIELERDIPPQEGDSGVTLREGTRSSSKAFEEQTKRLAHVEASLQVHEMEIESGKRSVRELSNRVSENNRNHLELMGEIEAKVDGFAETVEAIVFAKEAHERHQAKEEVPDPMLCWAAMLCAHT